MLLVSGPSPLLSRRIWMWSDHRAVLAQGVAQIGNRKPSRRGSLAQRHRRGHADRLAVGKALGGDPRRGHRLVLGRKTAPGHQEALAGNRNEAFVGNVVIIVEQPFEL